MADFCYDCTAYLFGEELAPQNDMRDLCEEGKSTFVLCEGCGGIEVNKTDLGLTNYDA
jgi:hypothetical protein